MIRRLLNLLTALSLLLCVAVCVLWARSHRVQERFTRVGGPTEWDVTSLKGRFYVHRRSYRFAGTKADGQPLYLVMDMPMPRPRQPWKYWREEVEGRELIEMWEPSAWKTLGVQWVPQREAGSDSGWFLRARWSNAAVLTALLPAWHISRLTWRRIRARRRTRTHLCVRCGYDLRATPGQCPECGAVTPAPPAPSTSELG